MRWPAEIPPESDYMASWLHFHDVLFVDSEKDVDEYSDGAVGNSGDDSLNRPLLLPGNNGSVTDTWRKNWCVSLKRAQFCIISTDENKSQLKH